MPAAQSRAGDVPLLCRVLPRNQNRPAFRVDPVRPGDLRIGVRQQELTRRSIKYVEVPVTIRLDQRLALLTLDIQVHQDRVGHRIPIMHVMGRELEMPLQRTRIGVERHDAARVEVVARPHITVHVRPRIAGAPIDQVQIRIVRPRNPGRTPAALPGVAVPGLVSRLTRTRHRPEPPNAVTGLGVVGIQKISRAELRPGDPHQNHVLDDQRRGGRRIALLVVRNDFLPQDISGLGVKRHEGRSEVHLVERVAQNREPAVGPRTTALGFFRRLLRVMPQLSTGQQIQRPGVVVVARDVHDAVTDQRGRLEPAGSAGLVNPRRRQALHGAGVDLIQLAVAPSGVVPAVRQPRLRIALRIEQHLLRDVAGESSGHEEQPQKHDDAASHLRFPPAISLDAVEHLPAQSLSRRVPIFTWMLASVTWVPYWSPRKLTKYAKTSSISEPLNIPSYEGISDFGSRSTDRTSSRRYEWDLFPQVHQLNGKVVNAHLASADGFAISLNHGNCVEPLGDILVRFEERFPQPGETEGPTDAAQVRSKPSACACNAMATDATPLP